MMTPTREEFEMALAAIGAGVPDSTQYQELSGITLDHALTPQLLSLDPFSNEYRTTVLQIYHDLRGSDRPYMPAQDERSGMVLPENITTGVAPWSFRDSGLVSEFLLSWGQIMRGLALPPSSDATILEYGSGSGQLLLFLARLGLRTFAVDIDTASLELVRMQAAALRLEIRTEQAEFGAGFGDETFDRIIFFEAFHHALDFVPLLGRLRRRLNSGGLLILCGEPVVGGFVPPVPYPWGPRLDGLSVFCIRRHGWMELGFTKTFLIEAFQRHGWLVNVNELPGCGRATTYVARPYIGVTIEVGQHVALGSYDIGWEGFEGTHRWTRGGELAKFPLPDREGPSQVKIIASNPFPTAADVQFFDGDRQIKQVTVPRSGDKIEINIGPCKGAFVGIKAGGTSPNKIWPSSADVRNLGLMVHGIRVDLV